MESLKFVGGSKLMKELQRTMFFAAYESVVFSSARSMTEKDQRQMLRESIIGVTGASDIMTLPEQMVLGLNQFSHLYDNVPVATNDDRNASTLSGFGTVAGSSRNEYDKVLKDCYFPQKSSGGKLTVYANKSDGITTSMLVAKNFSNPVHVSDKTIMRGAKEVLRNGRKALACAKGVDSEYKDGNLPSGKTIADYHRYIRECMYVKLRGSSGGENEDDDDVMSTTAGDKDDHQHDPSSQLDVVNPEEMPEDYCFSGMIAFFLWGFIIEDPQQCAVYQSKQFQIGDSVKEEKGANSRRQVKKEAASAGSSRRATTDGALPASPFRRGGQSLNQQIEIAKLLSARSMEDRRSLDHSFSTAILHIQTQIDTNMDLAKQWGVTDRNDNIFKEIKQLMADKKKLMAKFAEQQSLIEDRRRTSDELINNALLGSHDSNNKRLKSSASSISTTAGSTTPASSRGVSIPTPTSVLYYTSSSQRNRSPDVCHEEEGGRNEPEPEKELGTEEYYDCTVDIRECFQPRPPPFVVANQSHLNDDDSD